MNATRWLHLFSSHKDHLQPLTVFQKELPFAFTGATIMGSTLHTNENHFIAFAMYSAIKEF